MSKRIKNVLTFVMLIIALFSLFTVVTFSASALESEIALTVDGVALRTFNDENGKYGIRYNATVSNYSQDATYGMYIVPEDLKDDETKYMEVFGQPANGGGAYTYTCALTDILPSNTSRPFIAMAFARVGGEDVATSEWSEPRSIYTIATQALADNNYDKDEGVSNYLTEVVNTVHGEVGNLQGRYVVESVKVDETAVEDVNAFDFNQEFTLSTTVVKEGDSNRKLTAYPVVTVTNGTNDVTADVLSQVDAYGKYKFVKNNICDFTLSFNLGDTVKTVEDCNLDSYKATFNQDGSVTLEGMQAGDYLKEDWRNSHNLGYVAVEGEYGVGHYVDFYFTGNNMPYIMFFADDINANIGNGGGRGVILFNGVVYDDAALADGKETGYYRGGQLIAYGPNRLDTANYRDQGDMDMYVKGMDGDIVDAGVYKMTQIGLRQNSETSYKFTVGTYEDANGLLAFDLTLVNADTGILVHRTVITYNSTRNEAYKIPVSGLTAGNIILYSSLKADSDSPDRFTTFKMSEPYIPETKVVTAGATYSNGEVVLTAGGNNKNGVLVDDAWYSTISKAFPNNYLGFDGGYTVGEYIDYYFTGNNMPIVTLFANEINSSMGAALPTATASSQKTQTGYLISNGGFYINNKGMILTENYYVFGPNRIDNTLYGSGYVSINSDISKYNTNVDCVTLKDGVNYKYVVGSKVVEEEVVIVFELYELQDSTYTELYKGTYATGKTVVEVQALGDSVIAYAGVKGSSLTTTFAYSEFYTVD